MSQRLRHRGRYPKGPGVEQITCTNSQFPPSNSPYPTASEVPYYEVPPQSQPVQNNWANTSYSVPTTHQQNQIPHQPVPEPSSYWSSGQMYDMPMQKPPSNQQWNWKPENSENSVYTGYQQPPVPVADPWQQIPYSQGDNQNYSQQSVTYPPVQQGYQSAADFQPMNKNLNPMTANPPLPSWENGSLNITQSEQLPWTYGTPQYCNSTQPDFPQNFNPIATDTPSWNYSFEPMSQPSSELQSSSINYLPSDSSALQKTNEILSDNLSIDPKTDELEITEGSSAISASVSVISQSPDNPNDNRETSTNTEYVGSSLSAFFQNDQEKSTNNSECEDIPSLEVKAVLESSPEGSVTQLQINESEKSSIQSDEEVDPDEETDDEDEGNDFIQEEDLDALSEDVGLKIDSGSPLGFVEEPINQEVPEPNVSDSSNALLSVSKPPHPALLPSEQYNVEISQEEPLNQQIPIESGQASHSTSSESDRIVIRPHEDSPFKPPRLNTSAKGIVVQQEVAIQNLSEVKQTEEKTVAQEVNLETLPDNLERPPDYEELRKQSPLYVSHQKHLKKEVNSSPSSLLCDNLDIPCVTLAPAAPPIHSSARSDKSESSCNSKQGISSLDNSTILSRPTNGSKVQSSSPLSETENFEKSNNSSLFQSSGMTSSEAKSYKSLSQKSKAVLPVDSRQENPQQKYQQQQHVLLLKDSKINGTHPNSQAEFPRRSAEQPQTSSSSQSSSSRLDGEMPMMEPRGKTKADPIGVSSHRQRFADQKYQSFDERQYYSDRERSRPASRSSLGERPEDYMYFNKREEYAYQPSGDRRRVPPEYPRPSSRSSESDVNRQNRQPYDYRQQYPYNDSYLRRAEYYQTPPANYRGYEYDQYVRNSYYAQYYDAYQRQAYSNYNYGFYDEMYRNDPRYKQYQEQYRQYYAKYGYDGDYERSSLHSGRSSANELTKDVTPTQYTEQDIDSNGSEFSSYNYPKDYSYDTVPNESSVLPVDQSSTSSARLTPVKFSYAHPVVHFSPNGLLVTAIPSQINLTAPAPIRIQSLQPFMENEESFQDLKNYQGPLIRGLTHKNDVIEFCAQKIRSLKSKDVVDRDSHILLWELMVLLLRQNGAVAGSDIAELLLKDHEVLRPLSVPLKQAIETLQGDNSPADINDSSSQSHAGDASSPDEGIVVLNDKNSLNTSRTVDVDKVTRKFREFLLFGHKKDALEWAMKHGLWGHALFLASKMDLRTYANVMTRFANSLALNDPLQTLYQLMSGRQPSAVTFVADKKWGDWRPHLAMILSNPSAHPDVDSRSITTLGDTLESRGCLPAAHFCYIMAQVEFGTFEHKNSKLVLLSTDHRLPFDEFAINEAIQCTEIYEYAQSLANPGYMLSHLQMYKFLYALRLIEHGFLEEALHYLEVIAGNFQAHPNLFPLDFMTEVFKLGTQLKYHDPHFMRGQGELEDQDDPDWLKNLSFLLHNYNNVLLGLQQPSEQLQQEPSLVLKSDQMQTTSVENASYQNMPVQSLQNEIPSSVNNHFNYYQPNNWNQQITPQDNTNFYQDEVGLSNQSNFHMESSLPSHEENETTDIPSSPVTHTPPFDYYSGGTQQGKESRQSSFDYGSNFNSAVRRERRDSALSSASRYSAGSLSVANKIGPKEGLKNESKKDSKTNTQAGKTWLGGIFSRLLPKAPNQMILPDDKNPTIVWDDAKNCWVNKDSNDEDESSAPIAPPTDMELMGSKSSDKTMLPMGSTILPGNMSPDSSTINKFQRPKTRVMRQNYVDVLNTSGATTKAKVPPEGLFSAPFENTGSPKMFIPSATSVSAENSSEFESGLGSVTASHIETQEKLQAPLATPLMLDPAEFDARRSNMGNNHRLTLGRTGRRTYPT